MHDVRTIRSFLISAWKTLTRCRRRQFVPYSFDCCRCRTTDVSSCSSVRLAVNDSHRHVAVAVSAQNSCTATSSAAAGVNKSAPVCALGKYTGTAARYGSVCSALYPRGCSSCTDDVTQHAISQMTWSTFCVRCNLQSAADNCHGDTYCMTDIQ